MTRDDILGAMTFFWVDQFMNENCFVTLLFKFELLLCALIDKNVIECMHESFF